MQNSGPPSPARLLVVSERDSDRPVPARLPPHGWSALARSCVVWVQAGRESDEAIRRGCAPSPRAVTEKPALRPLACSPAAAFPPRAAPRRAARRLNRAFAVVDVLWLTKYGHLTMIALLPPTVVVARDDHFGRHGGDRHSRDRGRRSSRDCGRAPEPGRAVGTAHRARDSAQPGPPDGSSSKMSRAVSSEPARS